MAPSTDIVPVLLAGGNGTRLWPLSTSAWPKQFLPLLGGVSLFEATLKSVWEAEGFAAPIIATSLAQQQHVTGLLARAGITAAAIVVEGRPAGTAIAMMLAASLVQHRPDTILLFMPCDHVIADRAAMLRQIRCHRHLAESGRIVTFGIPPDRPETGYGYIKPGGTGCDGARDLEAFREKPAVETAARLMEEGWLWNSGLFLLSVATLAAAMARHQPNLPAACNSALREASSDGTTIFPSFAPFAGFDSLSFDHAVMEHTDLGSVVPVRIGWTDAGTWDELWRLSDKDDDENALSGNVIATETRRSLIRSTGPLTVVSGLEDIVVINTGSAVLVMPMEEARNMKAIIGHLHKDLA